MVGNEPLNLERTRENSTGASNDGISAALSRVGKWHAFVTSDTGTACSTDDVIMIWTLHVELHRHSKDRPRPDDFLPERWLVESGHKLFLKKDAWHAFGHGSRNCNAQAFVMKKLKAILAVLARVIDVSDAYEEWDRLHPRAGKEVERICRGKRAYQMVAAAAHPVEHYPSLPGLFAGQLKTEIIRLVEVTLHNLCKPFVSYR